MNYIEFLGTSGTKTSSAGTTCLRVSKSCVIDAGNLIDGMGEGLYLIEHIFLTHSHLDHIVDIAFMADLFVTRKKTPLNIYGLKETLNNLRDFIFNHEIWPNFEEINLIEHDAKTIKFIEIHLDKEYRIDEVVLTPFKTNHTNGSCGYLIEHDGNGVLFTSDTYRCQKIWDMMELYPHVHSLIVDVSFPSSYEKLAKDSKHMTPQVLLEELVVCKRQDFRVFPMHLKSLFETTIREELDALGILKRGGYVLEEYDRLFYDPTITIEICKLEDYRTIVSKITTFEDVAAILEVISTIIINLNNKGKK